MSSIGDKPTEQDKLRPNWVRQMVVVFLCLGLASTANAEGRRTWLTGILKKFTSSEKEAGKADPHTVGRNTEEDIRQADETASRVASQYKEVPLVKVDAKLKKFLDEANAKDLTEIARSGAFGHLSGREVEVRNVIEAYASGNGANVALIGDPGVGKSTVPKMLARTLVTKGDEVPEALQGARVISLNLSELVAGADKKDVIERMNTLFQLLEENPKVIIVLEELSLIGKASENEISALEAAKTYLADDSRTGKLLANLTTKEFDAIKKMDPANSRRWFEVPLMAPDQDEAYSQLLQWIKKESRQHQVDVPPEIAKLAIRLADEFMPDEKLPGSAVKLLRDVISSAVTNSTLEPKSLMELRRSVMLLESKLAGVVNKKGPHYRKIQGELENELRDKAAQLKNAEEAWVASKPHRKELLPFARSVNESNASLDQIIKALKENGPIDFSELTSVAARIEGIVAGKYSHLRIENPEEILSIIDRIKSSKGITSFEDTTLVVQLREIMGEVLEAERERFAQDFNSELFDAVTADAVIQSIVKKTGIPEELIRGSLDIDDFLRSLQDQMSTEIVGADDVVKSLVRTEGAHRVGAGGDKGAKALYTFFGKPGTGKTYITKVLARMTGAKLIDYNGSQIKNKHEVAKVVGAPPGYVGFEGVETIWDKILAANGRPVVILLDDAHLADPDFVDVLFTLRQESKIKDNFGKEIDCSNVTVVIAANTLQDGADELLEATKHLPDQDRRRTLINALHEADPHRFKKEMLDGMSDLFVFGEPPKDMFPKLVRSKWKEWQRNLANKSERTIYLGEKAIEYIAAHFKGPSARQLERYLEALYRQILTEGYFDKSIPRGSVAELEILYRKNDNGNMVPYIQANVVSTENGPTRQIVMEIEEAARKIDFEALIESTGKIMREMSVFDQEITRRLLQQTMDTIGDMGAAEDVTKLFQKNLELLVSTSAARTIESSQAIRTREAYVEWISNWLERISSNAREFDEAANALSEMVFDDLSDAASNLANTAGDAAK